MNTEKALKTLTLNTLNGNTPVVEAKVEKAQKPTTQEETDLSIAEDIQTEKDNNQ